MSIDQAREVFIGQQTSPETRRAYARDISVFLAWLNDVGKQAEQITEREAIAFRDDLVARFSPNGAARVWTTIKSLYRYARVVNPFDLIKGPKRVSNVVPKVPIDEDVDALVASASDNPQRALIIALLLNGLRASEVGGLLKENIEAHEGATILRVVGKGSKERLVPATTEVERALVRFNALATPGQADSAFVVADPMGGKLNYRQIEHCVYKTAEYAGISGMHPHALRHHFATRLIRNGVDVEYVKRLLGHARLDTTSLYIGLNLADLIKASRKDPRNIPTAIEAVA